MVLKNKDFKTAASELLALAVLDVFPKTKILETSPTQLGFGITFIADQRIDDAAFALIDERMRILIKKGLTIESVDMMRENAAELLRHKDQHPLAEKVLSDSRNIVSLIRIGEYYGYNSLSEELDSKSIGEGKLINYSVDDSTLENYGPCTIARIEGALCENPKSLKSFLKKYESAKKLDHRILGPQLELFFPVKDAVPGCWTWLPKGETIKETLISWWTDIHKKTGYSFVSTSKWLSLEAKKKIRSQSATTLVRNQQEFSYLSDEISSICEIFRFKERNYRELPLLWAETAQVFFPEPQQKDSTSLGEQFYSADSAYCFCTEEETVKQLISSLQFLVKSIKIFAIDYQWYLVSNDPKPTENQAAWDQRVNALVQALENSDLDYIEDSFKEPGRGPRIEARLIDSLGREWEGPSLELSPLDNERDLFYRGSDENKHRPKLIKRSLFGSLERFVAILVERYAGLLPIWLAPEQVRVLPVKEKHFDYARQVYQQLLQEGIRAELDRTNETLATKVFAVKTAKIPYAIVVGDNEQRNGTIAVCPCEHKGNGQQEKLSAFIDRLREEIQANGPFDLGQGTKVELKTD